MSTAIVLVGSSRGFGRSILESVMKNDVIMKSNPRVLVLLLTTSVSKSKSLFNEVYSSTHGCEYDSGIDSNVDVIIEEVDLIDTSDCVRACSVIEVSLQHHHSPVRSIFAFLNSGSAEPVGPLLPKPHERGVSLGHFMKSTAIHVNLNFLSFVALTKTIAQYCTLNCVDRARIVNISSLAAIKELYGMSIYSAIKGARDSFMRSLALEIDQKGFNPDIKFLSYAPGPMLTDLVRESLLDPTSGDNYVRNSVQTFVDPNMSADCCIKLLLEDSAWKSGSHLDFYDVANS